MKLDVLHEDFNWRTAAGVAALGASMFGAHYGKQQPKQVAAKTEARPAETRPAAETRPSTQPETRPADHQPIAWGAKVSPAFRAKVIDISKKLECNPNHLMAVMAFETGRTFRPSVRNQAGSSGTGLIQFMAPTARRLGTSTSELARMTPERQLDYVYKYLKPFKGQLGTLERLYNAVLRGSPKSGETFKRGTLAYKQNRGLDSDKNGVITPRESTARVNELLVQGMENAR